MGAGRAGRPVRAGVQDLPVRRGEAGGGPAVRAVQPTLQTGRTGKQSGVPPVFCTGQQDCMWEAAVRWCGPEQRYLPLAAPCSRHCGPGFKEASLI